MEMKKYVTQDAHVDQDMTPMIDVVFLLIIFFMVVTELSLSENADLTLPVAEMANVEEPQPGSRTLKINVVITNPETGEAAFRIGIGPPLTAEELAKALRAETVAFDVWEPNKQDPSKRDSLLEINVRCDWSANAGYIHKIYKACQDAAIFKVRIAAEKERVE